jgi:hypothetical protein
VTRKDVVVDACVRKDAVIAGFPSLYTSSINTWKGLEENSI